MPEAKEWAPASAARSGAPAMLSEESMSSTAVSGTSPCSKVTSCWRRPESKTLKPSRGRSSTVAPALVAVM
jgi:hypothetical protein